MRYSKFLVLFVIILFITLLITSPLLLKGATVYMPLIALGLALSLQKYLASLASYLLISFSNVFDIGDRVRIGNIKGDVRHIGPFQFILEEVGEDEKLGGELTGRLLYIPNLTVLDQPILNYSKECVGPHHHKVHSEYIFDEIRIPLTPDSDIAKASSLLDDIVIQADAQYVADARVAFGDRYPDFLKQALEKSRTQIHLEPQRLWLKGKFLTPFRERNDLRTKILMEFIEQIKRNPDIKLA